MLARALSTQPEVRQEAKHGKQTCDSCSDQDQAECRIDRENVGFFDRCPLVNVGAASCQLGAHPEEVAPAPVADQSDAIPFVCPVGREESTRRSSQENGRAGSLQKQGDHGAVIPRRPPEGRRRTKTRVDKRRFAGT